MMIATKSPKIGPTLIALSAMLWALPARADDQAKGRAQAPAGAVSYYKEVRPLFQGRCQGCHQPAKAGGAYVMTAFDRLVAGGESKAAAIVPNKPEESYLL